MSQAKRKHSPAFLTTTRSLNNDERRWAWERRKQDKADNHRAEMDYLAIYIVGFIVAALAMIYVMAFPPCFWIFSRHGIECLN